MIEFTYRKEQVLFILVTYISDLNNKAPILKLMCHDDWMIESTSREEHLLFILVSQIYIFDINVLFLSCDWINII